MTRGLFVIRQNNIDKSIYSNSDSYPQCLGYQTASLCKNLKKHGLAKAFSLMEEADMESKENEINDTLDIEKIIKSVEFNTPIYYINYTNFIKNSLYCEYAYIINLDENVLEFYKGFQTEPDPEGRYGQEPYGDVGIKDKPYYPCRLLMKIPFDFIMGKSPDDAVTIMSDCLDKYREKLPCSFANVVNTLNDQNTQFHTDNQEQPETDVYDGLMKYKVTISYTYDIKAKDPIDAKNFVLGLIEQRRLPPTSMTADEE